MSKFYTICLYLKVCMALMSCGRIEFNPWQQDIPHSMQGSTARNVERLELRQANFPIVVGLIADPQGTPGDLGRVVSELNYLDIDLVLVMGDLTDYGLKQEYIWTYEELERLQMPYFTVVGNHDALSEGTDIYRKMFGPLNYRFSYAGIEFFMWNNNILEYGSDQVSFSTLEHDLHDRSIIASHHPPVKGSNFTNAQVSQWRQFVNTASPLATLHGHKHANWYWVDEGVPYYIAPRVKDINYSLMVITEDLQVSFITCKSECSEENHVPGWRPE